MRRGRLPPSGIFPWRTPNRRWKSLAAAGEDTTACLANYINHPTRPMHRLFAEALLEVLETV